MTTDWFSHSPGSVEQRDWRKIPRWHVEAKKNTTKLNGKALRTPCIGFSWTDHKKRHDFSANKNACHHCSHDSDLRKMTRLYINDSLHRKKLQEQFSKCLESAAASASAAGFLVKLQETATITVLWDRKTRFKSIFVLMECYMTSPTWTKKGVRKYRRLVDELLNG